MKKTTKLLSVLFLLLIVFVSQAQGRKALTLAPASVSTLACIDSQTGLEVTFDNPVGITVDSRGNLFVIDLNCIRKITPEGDIVTFVGSPDGESGSDDGIGLNARFDKPSGITIDKNGILYVTDTYNNVIRKISPDGSVTTLKCIEEQTGSETVFEDLSGITVDRGGNLYVTANQCIQKINLEGKVTTLAGEKGVGGFKDGIGMKARFSFPNAIVLDSSENLYIADTRNNAIRKVTPNGVVTTLAGKPGKVRWKDGVRTSAKFGNPWGITIDKTGVLYVTDSLNHVIRKIMPDGTVSTVAGKPGKTGKSDGTDAQFGFPTDITIDANGILYVADTNNYLIRKIIMP